MKRYSFITLSALLCLLTLNSCKKQDRILPIGEAVCHCGVDDPLNDLQWLHETALYYESLRGKRFASISICTYDSTSQGFLITDCEECPDYGTAYEGARISGLSGKQSRLLDHGRERRADYLYAEGTCVAGFLGLSSLCLHGFLPGNYLCKFRCVS